MKKAIGMFSGGLDSWLSALVVQEQGFDVYLLHCVSPFFGYQGEKLEALQKKVEARGLKLIVHNVQNDYIDILINPKNYTGKSINSCTDCHLYMAKLAKKYMEELGAEFVFSGEVKGQRPLSQKRESMDYSNE